MELAWVVAAAVPLVSTVVWLVRLEGRVNVHEAVCAERYRRLDERLEQNTEKLHSIDKKLDRLISA